MATYKYVVYMCYVLHDMYHTFGTHISTQMIKYNTGRQEIYALVHNKGTCAQKYNTRDLL